MASWGFCVLVFDSSGEPAIFSEEKVGCTTSDEEALGASTGAPMELSLNLWHPCACVRKLGTPCYKLLSCRSSW